MSVPICRSLQRVFGRLLVPIEASCRCSKQYSIKVCEIGQLDEVRDQTNTYQTGQLFIHKVLSYRGVILYPWMAKMYARDKATKTEVQNSVGDQNMSAQESKTKTHPYYQVLTDNRDSKYVSGDSDSVTIFHDFGNGKREIATIKGLDYVAHEDILPYTTTETDTPIVNELFDKFLMPKPDNSSSFLARDIFIEWQKTNHSMLRLSAVYRETTNDVRVTVIPFCLGCWRKEDNNYWWRYCVRLENLGERAVKVIDKHLLVFSNTGSLDRLNVKPLEERIELSPGSRVYQYNCLISLKAPSGQVWGSYTMVKEDGTKLDCVIPPFAMEMSPEESSDSNFNLIG